MTADMAILLLRWMVICFGAGMRPSGSSSNPGFVLLRIHVGASISRVGYMDV